MKSDTELLAAWRDGDRKAGDALFARHFDAIYDFFDRKISQDVSDLVQRTFLGCVQGLDRFRGDCSPRTFLYAIARHELYYFLRQRKRDQELDFGVSSIRDLGPSPSSALGRRDDASALLDALETLPVELQILIELRFWEGLTAREVALVLDIPAGTVASRLRRALSALRTQLEARGGRRDVPTTEDEFELWARSVQLHPRRPTPSGDESPSSS